MSIENLAFGVALDEANGNYNHAPDINRYLGGANRDVSDHPFLKGFFYVFFGFPSSLFSDGTSSENVSRITQQKALVYTLSAAEDYTPPGDRQIKKEDIQGMGGIDASFISGQTIDRNFSIQYRDYWGAPIFRIHRNWTSYINPYYGGVTGANTTSYFAANEYKGTCMIIQTKPVTKYRNDWEKHHIIKVDYYDGVFPLTDLKSAYGASITENTAVRPTVNYSFDGFPLDETNPDVLNKALEILNSVRYDAHNSSAAIFQDLLDRGGPTGLAYTNNT